MLKPLFFCEFTWRKVGSSYSLLGGVLMSKACSMDIFFRWLDCRLWIFMYFILFVCIFCPNYIGRGKRIACYFIYWWPCCYLFYLFPILMDFLSLPSSKFRAVFFFVLFFLYITPWIMSSKRITSFVCIQNQLNNLLYIYPIFDEF